MTSCRGLLAGQKVGECQYGLHQSQFTFQRFQSIFQIGISRFPNFPLSHYELPITFKLAALGLWMRHLRCVQGLMSLTIGFSSCDQLRTWPSLERTWLLLFHAFPRCGRANQLSPQTKLVELVECGKPHQISSNDIELAFHAGVTQECNGGSKMLMTHDIHEIMQDS